MTLAFHRYANLFPLIEWQEFFELAENIRANGLYDRIDLIEVDGAYQLLDGRNRYRALAWLVSTGEALGNPWGYKSGLPLTAEHLSDYVDPFLYAFFDAEAGGDPLDYVLSKNLTRRHLTDDQRRMVAARIVNMR